MTIPEIRDRLLELAVELDCLELRTLAEATRRRRPKRTAPRSALVITEELRQDIVGYWRSHPAASHHDIAVLFHVNQGRVSEAINGKRR